MLIIHDLVEIDAGDTFAYDTARMAGQHEREALAADRIFGMLPADQAAEFRALWDEFEERAHARGAGSPRRSTASSRASSTAAPKGAAWRRHGVTEDRVIARNSHIAEGSAALWEEAARLIGDAVKSGNLAPRP